MCLYGGGVLRVHESEWLLDSCSCAALYLWLAAACFRRLCVYFGAAAVLLEHAVFVKLGLAPCVYVIGCKCSVMLAASLHAGCRLLSGV
jgi:hypothetical protein